MPHVRSSSRSTTKHKKVDQREYPINGCPINDSDTGLAPPFCGLKVIDCATYIAGPAAATVLADFGADVVKIEQPGEGDPYRALTSMPGQRVSDHNYGWLMDARNKRSLALDLKSGAGRDILYRLVAKADVFITNFPQPVRRRLGLGFEDLAKLNSRLIYAALSAYGKAGEEAEKTGFDSTAYWARSGLMDVVRSDAAESLDRGYLGRILMPTLLAPDVVEGIMAGRQPAELGAHVLRDGFPVERGS